MEDTNWLRQTKQTPLFPDVLWNRPENRRHAGKLLIIGGHAQSFNEVSQAYSAAGQAGVGTARVILPDKLQKMLSGVFPEAQYAPSTPIGSFSRQALDTWLQEATWADAVLLAGDFGRNSETAILLESFAAKYSGKLALSGDSLDDFLKSPASLLNRPNTLIVANLSQLQKLVFGRAFIKQNSDLATMVRQIHSLSGKVQAAIVMEHRAQIIAAYRQQISTTPVTQKTDMTALAAYATVWWLQQSENSFEALTTAVFYL